MALTLAGGDRPRGSEEVRVSRSKVNKERQVYAEGGADLLLARWLAIRGEGEAADPLFLSVGKDGEVLHTESPWRKGHPL